MLFHVLSVYALLTGCKAQFGNSFQSSQSSEDATIRSCPKCSYYTGDMPLNAQQLLRLGPNDRRCQRWNDGIPESEYENCGTAGTGEANACVYFNMTFFTVTKHFKICLNCLY